MTTKQERYIKREQEYVKTIKQLEGKIEDRSTRPLAVPKTQDPDELIAMGVDPSETGMGSTDKKSLKLMQQ